MKNNLFSYLLVAVLLLTGCNLNAPIGLPAAATSTPTATLPAATPTAFQPATETATPVVIPPTPTLAPSNTPAATETPVTCDPHYGLCDLPPYTFVTQQDDNGRSVTTMPGFDLAEYGGDDSACTRTELDSIHIGEVVGSEGETCLIVIEWSLKVDDRTIIAGTYALAPGEWFYVPLAVAGQNDSPRIIGTAWYLPKGWNSHMFAADIASDRDTRDGTTSIVGLSPTDPWVVSTADALK